MSNNMLYEEYKRNKTQQNKQVTSGTYNPNEVQSRYYKIYKEAQKKSSKTQSSAQKENIKSEHQNLDSKIYQRKTLENTRTTTSRLYNPNEVQSRYYQIYKENQQKQEGQQKNNTEQIKKTTIVNTPKVSKEIEKKQNVKQIKPNSKIIKNKKTPMIKEGLINKFVDFIDGLTIKKIGKFLAVSGIISYIIGYFIGQNLGNDMAERLEEKERIEEELGISTKAKEEYSLIDNEKQTSEILTKNNEEQAEKNDYAYAYNFANNIMEEKYGINISYDNELEPNIKTLKRTI